jgi:anti-anti-sigma factor
MTKRFSGLEVDELVDGQRYTLVLAGELDIASAVTLHGAVARARANGAAISALTLDLSGLIFIDSTGLAEIILTGQLCDRDGYAFALVPGPRAVQRLFEVTGLIDALPFTETAAEASPPPAIEAAPEASLDGVAPPAVEAAPVASLDGAGATAIVSKQELEGT